jgi:serine/threonine protein kinase
MIEDELAAGRAQAMIGQTFGAYRVTAVVGEGGMGIVYRAEDQRLGRTVALKFMTPELTRDETARARFRDEARAASALDHRNLCLVHDIGETTDGRLYIVMPFYQGESLQRRILRGALAPAETVGILLQACAGLAVAHGKGILHRDLKPANLLLTTDGEVKILDFGAAKLAEPSRLTRSGSAIGTLAYMAPEQLEDHPPDVRSEIWALGVMAYEMLTGELPFRGSTQASLVTAILHRRPEVATLREAAGPWLSAVVRHCLARQPSQRYGSVRELASDLERVRNALGTTTSPAAEPVELRALAGLAPTQSFLPPAARPKPAPSSEPPADSEPRTSRPVPLVVARDTELATLEAWRRAASEGAGRVGLVRGEEGRGKSTLIAELCRRAEADGRVVYAVGSCNAQSGVDDPYLPFRSLLAQLWGQVQTAESGGEQTAAHLLRVGNLAPLVASAIVQLGPQLLGTLVSASELLQRGRELAPPDAGWITRLETIVAREQDTAVRRDPDRSELFDAYTRVLQHVAERLPLLLVVEDLHWADGGSAALFAHLGRALRASPVLLLGTYRHEEVAPVPGRERHPFEAAVNELTRTFGDIEIDLDKSDGERFIDALLDAEPNDLDSDFRRRLLRCTSGLPLFVGELLRELRDTGTLARDGDGRWVVVGTVDWDLLPRRVEAVVAERVARLPDGLRSILTAASVQGEETSAELVARVLGLDERETVRQLSSEASRRYRMVTAAGVRHVAGQRQSLYRFRHALFQKYLYESLDEVERALLHEDTARCMEAMFAGREDEVVAQLAHHYRQARVLDKAIVYLQRAGTRAAHLSAHVEAVRLYEAALAELASLAPGRETMQRELDLTMALAAAQIALHGFGSKQVEARYLRARALCERLPEASDFPLLWGLFAFSAVRGEHERSLPLARRMLEACGPGSDPRQHIQSHYAVGVTEFFRGQLAATEEPLAAAGSNRDPELGRALALIYAQDSRKVAAAYACWVRWLRGDGAAALRDARALVQWTRQDVHPFTLSTVLLLTGFVLALAGDRQAAEHGEEMARLSREFELFQGAEATMLIALADLSQQPADANAADRLASALGEYRGRQWMVFVPFLLGQLARARLAAGDHAAATELTQEAWGIAETGGERFWSAELAALRSELAAAPEAAAGQARLALDLAREQGATWLELRAALALARVGGSLEPLAEVAARLPAGPELAEWPAVQERLASGRT